ncbi:hypothetical protein ACFU96_48010 [Streptomyces sp. NPDC057620]|uniref:hypothetical protein n=1 Tax=Streptomyces sp. NPDC057620 TaxID=3346185 RepID=UPI0036CB56F9
MARGNVSGSSARYTAPSSPAPAPGSTPGVSGSDGSIVAGGDIDDSHTEYGP